MLRLPHKINHFCCTKSGRPLYWEHSWHQISIFQKLSNQQSISQENRHYVTSSPSAISPSLNIKTCTWYDSPLFVVLKRKCLLESCLEDDVMIFWNPTPHMCLISLSLPQLCAGYHFERGKHMLWNSTARLFYLFISCPLTGKASGNTSFIHIHTVRT